MPKKRKENIPQALPNFDDFLNFPLAVTEEDEDGYIRKLYIDGKMKLVPLNDCSSSSQTQPQFVVPPVVKNIKKKVRFSDEDKENICLMTSSPIVSKGASKLDENAEKYFLHCPATPIKFNKKWMSLDALSASRRNSMSSEINEEGENLFPSFDSSLHFINCEDRKHWLADAKRRSRIIKKQQGLNDSFWRSYKVADSQAVLLKFCETQSIQSFSKIFPNKKRKTICKLGEGTFSEVFMITDDDGRRTVVKFIPVEGQEKYNGGLQTKFDDALSEFIVAKELTDLKSGSCNRCSTFVQMKSVAICKGKFPSYLQASWNEYDARKKSENDNPKLFKSDQLWLVLTFEFAGCSLEDYQIRTPSEAVSILIQVALGLACAEKHMEFEHRDLHWGNVLILPLDQLYPLDNVCLIDGQPFPLVHRNHVRATIIDFTFSRICKADNLIFVDMGKDLELFQGMGDIQFDIYRQMKTHNNNEWSNFCPKTNVLWLSYLLEKLLQKVDECSVASTANVVDDCSSTKLRHLRDNINTFQSVNDVVKFIYPLWYGE